MKRSPSIDTLRTVVIKTGVMAATMALDSLEHGGYTPENFAALTNAATAALAAADRTAQAAPSDAARPARARRA